MKKRLLSFALSAVLSLSAFSGFVSAESTPSYSYIPHPVSVGVTQPSGLKGAVDYPEYYNAYDDGILSSTKNQLTSDTCWIFAHNDLIEAKLRKDGEGDYDFSEQTIKFETSDRTDEHGYVKTPNGGGNEYMTTAFLARTGSVLEADEPFSMSEQRTVDPDTLTRYGHLNSVEMYNFSMNIELDYRPDAINKMKELILEYGSVGASLWYDDSLNYMTNTRSSYYYNGPYAVPNHAVTVVGWDDNYSKSNFRHAPKGDGAFIVKNSWGNTHNDNTTCYFYVSYYDKHITSELYVTDYDIQNDNYNNVYQYDHQGWTGSGSLKGNTALCVTNFTAKSKNESVTAVSTYVAQPNTTVEVLLSVDGGDIADEDSYVSVHKQFYDAAGYYYIEFDPVKLTSLRYAVAIRFTTTDGDTTDFAICSNYPGLVETAKNIPNTCYVATSFNKLRAIETSASYKSIEAMLCMKAFTKSEQDTAEQIIAAEKFTDVSAGKWYTDAISYAATYGVFGGVTDTTFEPDTQMNRAMFVRVLANVQGVDLDDYKKNDFDDVEKDRWYTGAVSWAAENEIVKGITDTTFEPYSVVTRQQMCVMLVRYCSYLGITMNETTSPITFKDDKAIQTYAKDAVYICQRAGIIKGVTADTFEPRSGASRAQVATMMMNFCKNYVYR